MPPPATAGLIRPFFKRKQCLHPLASRDVCGKVIAAHTIQRQGALASIVDGTGHCLTFYRAMGQDVSEPQRRGWREASTFAGFCEHHDSKAFAPLEGKPFVGSREQCFLMAYRAECHELYQKQASSRSLARLRQIVDRGLSPADQIAVQEIQRALRDGVLKGLNNSKRYKRIMDSQFLERRFDAYEKLFVQFDGPLAFAAAGAPTPNRSLSGEELCALHDPEAVIPRLYVGMARAAHGDAVVFVWREGEPAPERYTRDLRNLPPRDLPGVIAQFVFAYIENAYFSADWWATLSGDEKAHVRELATMGNPYYTEWTYRELSVPWIVTNISSEWETAG